MARKITAELLEAIGVCRGTIYSLSKIFPDFKKNGINLNFENMELCVNNAWLFPVDLILTMVDKLEELKKIPIKESKQLCSEFYDIPNDLKTISRDSDENNEPVIIEDLIALQMLQRDIPACYFKPETYRKQDDE